MTVHSITRDSRIPAGGRHALRIADSIPPAARRRRVPTTAAFVANNRSRVLVTILGAAEVVAAVAMAAPAATMVGIIGGAALAVAPWQRSVGLNVAFLVIGTLPFAALTWWTFFVPLGAIFALVLGIGAIPRRRRLFWWRSLWRTGPYES